MISAGTSGGSAEAAATSAGLAGNYATNSFYSAAAAGGSATNANGSANEAGGYRDKAKDWAQLALPPDPTNGDSKSAKLGQVNLKVTETVHKLGQKALELQVVEVLKVQNRGQVILKVTETLL